MKKARHAVFSGLWETESVENYEAFLVACGYNVFRRKLALLHQSQPTHFYKHRGGELEFSQMLNGRVLTSYMRVGERTEVELPDGSTTFVVSAWEGSAWKTVDDSGTLETRRWLDGDTLMMTERCLKDGQPVASCKRVFRWIGSDPIWSAQSGDTQVLLSRAVHTEEEEDYVDEPPLPAISEVTKAGAKAAATGVSLVSALSSSITDGWSALETMLADKPPGGDKDWHAFFNIDRKQKLLGGFNCGLAGDTVVQGRLYVFEQTICFYSTFVGNAIKTIRASDMTDVSKVNVAALSGLEIRTLTNGAFVFTNFLSRDQAYDMVLGVMWSFADADSAQPAPIALGFSGERYLFVRVNAARPSSSANAPKSGLRNCFVRLAVGQYEARTVTVENSSSPQFDAVCIFPCSVLDPACDSLTVSLLNESARGQGEPLGERSLGLKATAAAPALSLLRASWHAPSTWHKLEMASGGGGGEEMPQAEVSLSVWTASSADPAFRTARAGARRPPTKRSDMGDTSRVKTYEEPRMAYLFLEVRRASGLRARHGKPNGMCDPFCHITVGGQRARTRLVQDTLSPAWEDSFTFVVEKPLAGQLLLELYDGEQRAGDFIGQVAVALQDVTLRRPGARTTPAPRWHRITRRRDAGARAAGGELGGEGGGEEAREHLGELELRCYLDSDYLPQEADHPPVGQLSVTVVRARQLARPGDTFCVLHYGRSWARLPTLSSAAAEWRQELLLPVRDMSDVLAVGVFRDAPSSFLAAATEEFLGKACVRPGTLLPGRAYRRSVPLLLGHKDGVVQTGVLDLHIRFVRYSAAATVARYLALPLPPKCYLDPPADSTARALPAWEEALVEAHLSAAQPPLSATVQAAMRPVFDPRLSMRLLRVHVGRLLARFLSDRAAGPSLLDPAQWWEQPGAMLLLHLLFVFLVFNPQLLLPLLLTAVAAWGFSSSRAAPLIGADPWLSTGGQFAEAASLLRGGEAEAEEAPAAGAEPALAIGDEWATKPLTLTERGRGAEAPGDALDTLDLLEEVSEAQGERQLSAGQQKQLFRALALYSRAAQHVADHYATRLEQAAGVLSWREPLVSRGFFTLLLLAALALFFIPLRSVVLAAGLYAMRHPALRAQPAPSVLPFFLSRLSSLRDHIV